MVKINPNISFNQARSLIRRWPISRKARLVRELSEETKEYQWDQLLRRIRAKARRSKITQKEINQAVKEVRQELYDSRRR